MHRTIDQRDLSHIPFLKRLLSIFLRTFFKLLYHQFAWCYDFVAWVVSLGHWNQWVVSVLPYLQGPRVLELGFGPGHLQTAMANQGITAFGLDESREMAYITQKRLRSFDIHSNLVRGDAISLPFRNEGFNQVVVTFPAEFILEPATIAEIKRILVSRGILLALPLAWLTGRKPWERLIAWINRVAGQAPVWNPVVLDPLRKAGFEVHWQEINLSNSKAILIQLVKPG